MLRRTLLILLGAALPVTFLFYAFHTRETEQRLEVNYAQIEAAYAGVSMGYKEFADVISGWILGDPEVINLLHQIQEGNDVARGLLYRHIFPLYDSLRTKHVRQLQFFAPDGKSILRMHAPERSDDDLSQIRPLMMRAMATRKATAGFENGRLMSGFRYCFPITDGDSLLGGVEVSLSFTAIQRLVEREVGNTATVRFLLERNGLMRAISDDLQDSEPLFDSLYLASAVHPKYVTENFDNPLFEEPVVDLPSHTAEVESQIGNDRRITAAMNNGEAFARHLCNGLTECFFVNGLPIRNDRNQAAGYILTYSPDEQYLERSFTVLSAFGLAILLLVAATLLGVRLQLTRRRLTTLSEHVGKGIYVLDRKGNISYTNPAASALLGYSQDEFMGQDAHDLFHVSSGGVAVAAHACPIRCVTERGEVFQGDQEVFRSKDGTYINVEVTASPIIEAGETVAVVTVFSDIRDRLTREQQLRQTDAAVQAAVEGVLITDTQGKIVAVNPAFTRLTGYAESEVIGRKPSLLSSGRHSSEFYAGMWRDLLEEGIWQGEILNRRKNGSVYPQWLSISAIRDIDGQATSYVGVFNDISDLKEKEDRLFYLAHFDSLTGLPNRRLLRDRLEHAMARADREGSVLGVLFVDLDRFKQVNDSLGHEAGDQLICQAAERIGDGLRHEDTLARQGGDEFVILLEGLADSQTTSTVAMKLIEAIKPSFRLRGFEDQFVVVGASIGIAMYPRDGQDASTLLRRADAAMYVAKSAGGNTWQHSNEDSAVFAEERLQLESELRHALDNDELVLHYQPKVNLSKNMVEAVEALIRWEHPTRGLLGPDKFLPLAKESGLIVEIGNWVMQRAVRQIVSWENIGITHIRVYLNIDGSQLARNTYPGKLLATLRSAGIPPNSLGIEVTETAMMGRADGNIAALKMLREHGIALSIDDFGTGHSSLNRLKRLPIDTLKIDRSFIRDMVDDPSDQAIVRATVALAQELGLHTVAEGVETEAQLAMLREMGCTSIQGYLVARPMPASELPGWLADKPTIETAYPTPTRQGLAAPAGKR